MSDQYLMSIDIGTTGIKAALYDDLACYVDGAYVEQPLTCERPGWAEQDPRTWWQGVVAATRQLLAKSRLDPGSILAISVTGQQPSPVFLDGEGEVLGKSLIWMDRRTSDECQRVADLIGSEALYNKTGLRADAMYGIYKIMWLQKHRPELSERLRYVLQPKDFINYRLTGKIASDYASSAAMQGLGLKTLRWEEEIFQAAGVPLSIMPELHDCTDILGNVSAQAASKLGLSEETCVMVSAGDTTLSALGCGVMRAGDTAVVIGTSSDVVSCVRQPVFDHEQRIGCYPYVVPGLYMTIAGANSSGIALRWLRDQLLSEGSAKLTYDELTEAASSVAPGCGGLLFLPYLSGERSPVYNPEARGIFAGISLMHSRPHFVRAVLEGVALSVHDRLSITRALGAEPARVVLSGGGAKSELWRQIITDMIGLPTTRADVSDSALLGAAMVAAVGSGLYSSLTEACEKMMRFSEGACPDEETHATYQKVYRLYKDLYEANASFFSALAQAGLD